MLRIPAELEKGNQDRLYPVAPEFAEFLLATPEDQRTGPVFNPLSRRPWQSSRLSNRQVSRIGSDIGKAACVKVADKNGKVKFASVHDLRRSFGERWAPRVMPQVLMQLMRHETIETTMKYYVGHNAESTARALYAAVGQLGQHLGQHGRNRDFASTTENAESRVLNGFRRVPRTGVEPVSPE